MKNINRGSYEQNVSELHQFVYLGSIVSAHDGTKFARRIKNTKSAFVVLSKFGLPLSLKLRGTRVILVVVYHHHSFTCLRGFCLKATTNEELG